MTSYRDQIPQTFEGGTSGSLPSNLQDQDLRTKLFKINFPLPDWQILDILYKGLSGANLREFIQTKIEAKRTSKAVAVTLDIDTFLDEISTRLPAETNQPKPTNSNPEDSSEPK
ncbi:hypothetical protein GX50_05214 [[Emmonsia] crescens]|uniref:Uncharacterized protein n=1 Tax=[Emmonsia] crescens TaxID=73230 RepID=A0A2B7ZF91_9EURO|nr:hypothetical protein GX50_05214 [Emmonsia crescens]